MDLADRREAYETAGLDVADVAADPIAQFEHWFRDAEVAGLWEPNAMSVSTVDPDGTPSSRILLLKHVDERGFVFYTNYESAKARGLAAHPAAALTFAWLPLRRQVRVVGTVSQTSAEESDAYFSRRPRGSQLGAWASEQSTVLVDRAALEARYAEVERRFAGCDVPRPPHWGGYRVQHQTVEFWQGRPNRQHDRIRYEPTDVGWQITRLAP